MKSKRIGTNAVLNVIKSALSVLFPLITYPYALRILGSEGIGKVSYGQSIISYFTLFAMLGVATYGVREGAKHKKNTDELNKFVSEVFTINVITTTISYLLLFALLLFSVKLKSYSSLLLLQSISIVLTTMGMDWVNTLFEDYFVITVRSIISHIITLALLFIIVKTPGDYYWYAFLTVLTNGIICISNWIYIRRYVHPRITLHPNIKRHIKPLVLMFSNAVAVAVYVNFDTTMLGWMKGDHYVGLYALAVRVYTIIKSMMQAVYAVTIPRLSLYSGEHNIDKYKELYTKIWGFLVILLIPSGVGLACVSREVVLFMGGKEFLDSTATLQILSASLIFAIFGGLTTSVLNITTGREKWNLMATLLSAAINCGLNFIFIPLLNQNGAAITTLISEIFVFVFCIATNKNIKNYLDIKSTLINVVHSIIGCIGIVSVTYFVRLLGLGDVVTAALIICFSVVVYVLIQLILKNKVCKEAFYLLKRKLKIGQ